MSFPSAGAAGPSAGAAGTRRAGRAVALVASLAAGSASGWMALSSTGVQSLAGAQPHAAQPPAASPRAAALPAGHRGAKPPPLPKVLPCAIAKARPVFEPSSFILSCADANTYFSKIRWVSWTATSATGEGSYNENTCTPSCVQGHFVSAPGTITLSAPKRTALGTLFSRVSYSYTFTRHQSLPTSLGR